MSSAYDPDTGLNFGGNASDRGVYCEFYQNALQNNAESEKQGRPIFDDKVFVRIRQPGDRLSEVDREAKDQDKRRFPIQWALFEQGRTVAESGTPLEEWPLMSPATIRTFKALNIFTVEQMAAVTDGNLANLGTGGRKFRDAAIGYLERAAGGAQTSRLAAENEKLQGALEVANANIADLAAAIKRLEARNGTQT